MSIVGPRPTLRHQVDRYTERQRGRLSVKPGITGWAQVNGRASLPWPERIELDLWYVEHRSLALDLQILRRTVDQVIGGNGLYKGEGGGWQSRWRERRLRARRRGAAHRGGQALRAGLGLLPDREPRSPPTPTRWHPAQYAAHHRRSVPRFDDPAYVPALQALCDEFGVTAVVPADRP